MHQTWFLVACLVLFRFPKIVFYMLTVWLRYFKHYRMGELLNSWCTLRSSEGTCDDYTLTTSTVDSGLSVTGSIPIGTRVIAGLFQGLAARASGFSIVPVASLAPAVQYVSIHEKLRRRSQFWFGVLFFWSEFSYVHPRFLYVVMMYIAVSDCWSHKVRHWVCLLQVYPVSSLISPHIPRS